MPLVRQNALSVEQWVTILIIPQDAGVWDIDWSDELSDAES
jgi:hypothetical protein